MLHVFFSGSLIIHVFKQSFIYLDNVTVSFYDCAHLLMAVMAISELHQF